MILKFHTFNLFCRTKNRRSTYWHLEILHRKLYLTLHPTKEEDFTYFHLDGRLTPIHNI